MRKAAWSTLVAVICLLTAACAPAPHVDGKQGAIEAVFACGPDIVRARFEQDRLTLRLGGDLYVLEQARSASGARYLGTSAAGPTLFWNKGREATLEVGARKLPTCTQQGSSRHVPAAQ